MTELRTVDAIILEAYELAGLVYDSDLIPVEGMLMYIDNVGNCVRDYPQLYPKALPYLAHMTVGT